MGLDPVEQMVGEHTFKVVPFVGSKGYRLFLALSRVAAPGMARAAGAVNLDAETGNLVELIEGTDFDQLGSALEGLAEQLSEETMWALTERILETTYLQGADGWVPVKSVFDMIFTANYGELFQVLALVLRVNYEGPLAGLLESASGKSKKD